MKLLVTALRLPTGDGFESGEVQFKMTEAPSTEELSAILSAAIKNIPIEVEIKCD